MFFDMSQVIQSLQVSSHKIESTCAPFPESTISVLVVVSHTKLQRRWHASLQRAPKRFAFLLLYLLHSRAETRQLLYFITMGMSPNSGTPMGGPSPFYLIIIEKWQPILRYSHLKKYTYIYIYTYIYTHSKNTLNLSQLLTLRSTLSYQWIADKMQCQEPAQKDQTRLFQSSLGLGTWGFKMV